MAKRGRKPKPTALKKLEGNPGKRPLNELEPLPQVTMLRCPNWLEPEARKEWRRLAPVLIGAGILTGADAVPFAGYCQAYARWKEAEQEVTKLGMVYRDGDRRQAESIHRHRPRGVCGSEVAGGGVWPDARQPHRDHRGRADRGKNQKGA